MLAKSPRVTLYTGGSDGFVASTAAPLLPSGTNQFSGGTFTRSEPALFTAHGITNLEFTPGKVCRD
jgi:hypothetical protein